jgi:glucose-1-phosphate thymidylyltransferase
VGPGVSIGSGALVENSRISDSIVQASATIKDARLHKAMVGKSAEITGTLNDVSLGDFSKIRL